MTGDLADVVYVKQPLGSIDTVYPENVCKLGNSLYSFKQSPRAWYHWFVVYIASLGFFSSKSDSSLFTFRHGNDVVYLLLYVDDIILTASSPSLVTHVISRLSTEFFYDWSWFVFLFSWCCIMRRVWNISISDCFHSRHSCMCRYGYMVCKSPILPFIQVLQVPCSIWCLIVHLLHFLFNMPVYLCLTRVNRICMLCSAFFAFFRALLLLVYSHVLCLLIVWSPILMLSRSGILTPDFLIKGFGSFSEITWCLGLEKSNMLSLDPAFKLNITMSPMLLLKQHGFVFFSLSYTILFLVILLCFVTMSVPSI